jgi:hypothetical protein
MKARYLICLIFVIVFSISGYSATITTKTMYNGEWEWHEAKIDAWSFFIVKLTPKNKIEVVSYTYGFGENQAIFNGSFRVIDDQTISGVYEYYSAYDNEPPVPNFKPKQNTFNGKIVILENSVQYDTVIKLNNGVTLLNRNHIVPAGLDRTVDGVKVKTMGCKPAVVTENAKIRIKPSIDSDTIKYAAEFDGQVFQYCPADTKITVLARTENKEKINNWNNYWFYVELTGASEYEVRYGWIFAEFIKIK